MFCVMIRIATIMIPAVNTKRTQSSGMWRYVDGYQQTGGTAASIFRVQKEPAQARKDRHWDGRRTGALGKPMARTSQRTIIFNNNKVRYVLFIIWPNAVTWSHTVQYCNWTTSYNTYTRAAALSTSKMQDEVQRTSLQLYSHCMLL